MKIYSYKSYDQYLNEQNQHQRTRERTIKAKKERLSDIANIKILFPKIKNILCIGCRHSSEIEDFETSGFEAVGIDLFQGKEKKITICDMHNLNSLFTDKSFDFVYMSHSLEHSYDVYKVLDNVYNVAKIGFFAALPEQKEPNKKDPTVFDFMANENRNIQDIQSELNSKKEMFEVIKYEKRNGTTRGKDFFFFAKII